tara:strand:+ start:5051 stop:6010 length:960 start_codon:yes stop_codon:yes gene_type:complete
MEEGNETQPHRPSLNAGANANAEGGTDNTDTSLNGEYRAGAGIYVNAQGEWTDPNGTVLRGQALMNAEANASAKYGVGYRNGNLYIEAVAEAKLRAEVSLKAEIESGQHAAGVELYAYAELYAWAGGEANVGMDGCWFEGGAIAGAKAGAGTKTYYTNESLGVAATNNTSVSAGAQVGGTIGGGYQVPDWNQDSKPITIGGSVNLALIVGVKTEGTVTVDVDPAYDAIVETNNGIIEEAEELLKTKEAQRIKREAEEAQRKLDETAAELKRQSDAAAVELKRQTDAAAEALRLRQAKEESDKLARKIDKSKANPKNWKF